MSNDFGCEICVKLLLLVSDKVLGVPFKGEGKKEDKIRCASMGVQVTSCHALIRVTLGLFLIRCCVFTAAFKLVRLLVFLRVLTCLMQLLSLLIG